MILELAFLAFGAGVAIVGVIILRNGGLLIIIKIAPDVFP